MPPPGRRLSQSDVCAELDWERRHPGGAWASQGNSLEKREAAARGRCLAIHWEGAKPLRVEGAWPGHPGHPRHPGMSGLCEALATRQQLASAKHHSTRGPPTPGCPGCLGCPGSPPPNDIPCGRSVHLRAVRPLAGGPSTCGRSVHLRAARPLKVAFVLYAVAQGW